MEAGRSSVSSGSANTAFASSAGEKMIFLMCVFSSDTTAERPTSEPVPAVVGSATNPRDRLRDRAHLGMVPRVVEDVAVVVRHQRHGLGDVERGAPPPMPMTASARCALYAAAPAITWLRTGLPEMSGKDRDVEPGQIGHQCPEQRQRGDAAVGDQQRARNALRFQVVGDEFARAGTEVDRGREAEAFDAHHVPHRKRIMCSLSK